MRLFAHMRALWPRFTFLPAAPFVLWAGYWGVRGQLRWEQLALATACVALAYGNAKTKRIYIGLFPMALLGLIYDAMRFVKNLGIGPSHVHLCDLREAEIRLFGITVNGERMALSDYFYAKSSLALDVFCAIPYGLFLFVPIGYAFYLHFRDESSQHRFAWGFLLVNLLGFVTYHLYPAAPPWYFHRYGCEVDLAAKASEGIHLARVDALLGIDYFAGLYGRSSDVFGAMPSLHVAYPSLMVMAGWRHHEKLGKSALLGFYGWMCFSAVYLDHHWVLDIVVGTGYALFVSFVLKKLIAPESRLAMKQRASF